MLLSTLRGFIKKGCCGVNVVENWKDLVKDKFIFVLTKAQSDQSTYETRITSGQILVLFLKTKPRMLHLLVLVLTTHTKIQSDQSTGGTTNEGVLYMNKAYRTNKRTCLNHFNLTPDHKYQRRLYKCTSVLTFCLMFSKCCQVG